MILSIYFRRILALAILFLIFLILAMFSWYSRPSFKRTDFNLTFSELPDFSYAGSKINNTTMKITKWKTVDVTDFGAYPDDRKSDTLEIQAALDYAISLKGAILKFPSGKFIIDNIENVNGPLIIIKGSNLLVRGSGTGEKKTTLFFPDYLKPSKKGLGWSTPHLIEGIGASGQLKFTTRITDDAKLDSRKIVVKDSNLFSIGDTIQIALNDPNIVDEMFETFYKPLSRWSELHEGKLYRELNQILEIDGNTLILEKPLMLDIKSKFNWDVKIIELGEVLSFENLRFEGNWLSTFKHHRSAYDDSAWSAVKISNIKDSWFKNLEFINWNETLTINTSSQVTISNLVYQGNRGHFGLHLLNSHRVLVENSADCSQFGQHHPFSVSSYSSGTVFFNVFWPKTTTFDSHARFPHATLLDNVTGGFDTGPGKMGGAPKYKPNHLENYILWNYTSLDTSIKSYGWWDREHILFPKIFGWNGPKPNFEDSSSYAFFDLMSENLPDSLFLHQIQRRGSPTDNQVKLPKSIICAVFE